MLLGIYPEKTTILNDKCIPVFIVTLLTIARTWRQPRCPLTDEWIKKMWYIYTMEYYSAIQKNEYESVRVRWMNQEPVIQWSNSEREKTNTVYMKSRKMVLMNLFSGKEWRCRYREWTCGHTRGKGRVGRSSPLYYTHTLNLCVCQVASTDIY